MKDLNYISYSLEVGMVQVLRTAVVLFAPNSHHFHTHVFLVSCRAPLDPLALLAHREIREEEETLVDQDQVAPPD